MRHGEHEYVKVSPTKEARFIDDLVICYATLPDALVVSLSEDLLKRILDRRAGAKEPEVGPWLGKHICLRVRRELLEVLEHVFGGNFRREMRRRSWGNLPILNELRRLHPEHDPVELYERLTGVRLLCPGGGRYVWSEEWMTMESTAFGHPGRRGEGPADVLPLRGWKLGNFGLTFEKDGLRAACELQRR
jgi:hypothetical protein